MSPPFRPSFPVVLLHYIPVKISCRISPPPFQRDGLARILSSNSRSGLCASENVTVGQPTRETPLSSSVSLGKHRILYKNTSLPCFKIHPPLLWWQRTYPRERTWEFLSIKLVQVLTGYRLHRHLPRMDHRTGLYRAQAWAQGCEGSLGPPGHGICKQPVLIFHVWQSQSLQLHRMT